MKKRHKYSAILPEVLFANGDKSYSYYLSDLTKNGLIRRVLPKVYTSNLAADSKAAMHRALASV